MVIISYIIKHIITNKNKILHKLFYALFAPYNKKKWKKYRICFRIHTEFYIYHLRKYRMNLRFTFYESLQAQCSKQEYKFVYKILYPIYSQSKKNDQKTDYRIITVSDRFQPSYNTEFQETDERFYRMIVALAGWFVLWPVEVVRLLPFCTLRTEVEEPVWSPVSVGRVGNWDDSNPWVQCRHEIKAANRSGSKPSCSGRYFSFLFFSHQAISFLAPRSK